MFTFEPYRRVALLTVAVGLALSAAVPRAAVAQPAGIDPEAVRLLKAATSFLAGQKQFTVDTHSSIEVVLHNGQKLEFDQTVTLNLQRPDRMKSERRGELVQQEFYYDGKTLTLFNPAEKYFATAAVPGTIDGMIDFARDNLDIVAPACDLIYSNSFDILMKDVTSASVVGKSVIAGVRCDHLAFRAPGVDWQIWIEEGSQPLPRKWVITSTDVVGSPEFSVVMDKWNTTPNFGPGFFEFKRPADAKQIEFQPVSAAVAPSK